MLDQGRVLKVERDRAWVEFAASSACASCGACHQAASGKMMLEAENPVGAKMGDRVEVEISSAARVLGPLLVFGTPILFLLLGIIIGGLISETAGIVLGIIFLVVGFLFLKLIDEYVTRQKKFRNRIIRVLLEKEMREMAKDPSTSSGRDPVCGMEVIEGKIFSEYKGNKYCFCSQACRENFEQDPEKHVKLSEKEKEVK
jgi:sigma-E factor negative regulatory protein RseC